MIGLKHIGGHIVGHIGGRIVGQRPRHAYLLSVATTADRKPAVRRSGAARLVRESSGQSLLEIAVMLPLLVLVMAYAVDFGYFFIAAANITSAAHNAAEYSALGYSGPAQASEPQAGPISATNSVAALALADLGSLLNSSTTTTIQVCSEVLGMSGNIPKCASYGQPGTTYTPAADPEAPTFVLQRVDITYTVHPPIPLSIFGVSLLPNFNFHRQVSMRAMD